MLFKNYEQRKDIKVVRNLCFRVREISNILYEKLLDYKKKKIQCRQTMKQYLQNHFICPRFKFV